MGSVRVAIVGVGNCAASLVQGVEFYKDADPAGKVPGLMHVQFGEYHVRDVEFVAAFDVDAKKVGLDLSDAIGASENNTIKLCDVPNSRRDRPAWPHPRRPGQVLPRDHRGVGRGPGRHRPDPQGPQGRRPRLLPAGRFRGRCEVLRAVRHRRQGRVRQRSPGLHRRRPRSGRTSSPRPVSRSSATTSSRRSAPPSRTA